MKWHYKSIVCMAVDYLQKMHRLPRRYSFRPFQLTSLTPPLCKAARQTCNSNNFNPPLPNLHSKLSSLFVIEYFPTIVYKCSLKCAEFTQEKRHHNSNKEAPLLIPKGVISWIIHSLQAHAQCAQPIKFRLMAQSRA